MEKFRSRKVCLMLYPEEDLTHKKALGYIKNNYDYAYIIHDKDFNEVGELKKSHVHVIVQFQNAKWNTAFAEELEITSNYIQPIRNFENCLEYLIHYNDENKYQYEIDEVQGNLKKKLIKYLANDGQDENEKSLSLIDYIENYEGFLSVSNFAKYTCSVGQWDVFRRASGIYLQIIQDHNYKYLKK